ncbi:MAG: metallopeptidase family protein [Candidatus Staskawiczbacteria bacterium]|jgi:predicted Zn-dependent protease with MMP-like domain
MTHEEFEKLVAEGIDLIDEKFLQKLKNVEIVIEDDPTPFQLEKLKIRGGFLLGLYEGIPQTKRESYGQVLPDKITIFKNQIERVYFRPEDIRKAVANTVWHEIAHHFGMDEHQVREAERKRHK